MVGRVGADSYACADAAYVSLEYRVLEASSRPGAARFMLNLLDASDCDGCTNVADLEAWFNMELGRIFSGEGGIDVTDAVDTRSGTAFVRRRDVLENENHIDEGIAIAFHPVIAMKKWPGNP